MLPCLFKKFTGMDCPGCGAQRALSMVIQGDFGKAFHLFPAIYTTLLMFMFLGIHLIDKSRDYHKIIITLAIANAVVIIAAFAYKISTY